MYVRVLTGVDGGTFSMPFETFDKAKRSLISQVLAMAERCREEVAEDLTELAEDINLETAPFTHTVRGRTFAVYKEKNQNGT